MRMSKFSKIALSLALTAGLVGCGGGSSSGGSSETSDTGSSTGGSTGGNTSGSATVQTQTGVLIDDVVVGAKYKTSGFENGVTNDNGEFSYRSGTIEFFLGNLKVGEMSSMPADKKAFLTDILGLQRGDYQNEKLVKLARLLQSLDNNKGDNKITLDNSQVSTLFSSTQTLDDVNISNLSIDLVSAEVAMEEVKSSYKEEGVTPIESNTTESNATSGGGTTGGSTNVSPTLSASLTYPTAGAKITSGEQDLNVTFTSAVKNSDITVSASAKEADNAKLKCGSDLVDLKDKYANNVLTLTATLPEKKDCTLTLTNITGTNGASIASKAFNFSTGDSNYPTANSANIYENSAGDKKILTTDTTRIALTFSEEMADLKATDIKFVNIDNHDTSVTFTVSKTSDAKVWDINTTKASTEFSTANQHFTLTVKTTAKDASGLGLKADKVFSFNTKDTVAPTLTSIKNLSGDDINGTKNQDNNETFVLTFNEPIDGSTVNATNIAVDGSAPVNVALDGSNPKKVNITLQSGKFYEDNQKYTITIGTDVTDTSGNKLEKEIQYEFTAIDKIAPTATLNTPSPTTDVAPTKTIKVEFSEDMKNNISSDCSPASNCVTVTKDDNNVTLDTTTPLAISSKMLTITLAENTARDGAKYNVTLLKGKFKDTATNGNTLDKETSFSFTAINDAPKVDGNATAYVSTQKITIIFDENITINDLNVTITQGSIITAQEVNATSLDNNLTLSNNITGATDFNKTAKIVIHIEDGNITDLLGKKYDDSNDIEVDVKNIKD